MGKQAQILLVARIVLLAWPLWSGAAARADSVDAAQYQAFWLWAAVRPQPVLHHAHTLYLHQGEIARRQGKVVFLRQGIPVSKLRVAHLWLSYRMTTLSLSDEHLRRILALQESWRRHGNRVRGIQLDFDAQSYRLAEYAAFLRQLRRRVPDDCRISITGLLDWARTGDVAELNRLRSSIDELVIQTYQGRGTVTNYADYLPALNKLTIPFRLGLVQYGKWDRVWQRRLAASPYYRGEVVFLVNPPGKKR
ncbi:DUF3142 domain-containing protein [Brenneria populi]|uniref:DUF3142 domain-containing protein n=1 Tax=Brenneria populi TaxID=1505588 RepID=A0ABU6JSB7_9GAMM|nr:DUF3142 domain-containing protein [Brenneria populi Li et al. 2015]